MIKRKKREREEEEVEEAREKKRKGDDERQWTIMTTLQAETGKDRQSRELREIEVR